MKEEKAEKIWIGLLITAAIIFCLLIVSLPILNAIDIKEKNDYCESLGYNYYETKILNPGSTNTKQYINCYTEYFDGNDFVIRESGWRLYE